jgi:hypothetical protein
LSYDGAELFPRRLLFQSFPPFAINITYFDKSLVDAASGSSVKVRGVAGDANSGPMRVAATSAQTVFCWACWVRREIPPDAATACNKMNLPASPVGAQTAPQPQVSALTSAPSVDASADGSAAFFNFASEPGRPMAGWNAATPANL